MAVVPFARSSASKDARLWDRSMSATVHFHDPSGWALAPVNVTTGFTVPPPPIRPVTITYKTAASTTVMATMRMVAITGDTPESSLRMTQLRFMGLCPPAGFPAGGTLDSLGYKRVGAPIAIRHS